ncbi:hypothetical protein [Tessaracoccus antarcticus]|uniref:hypothetical protein n=1 Tax=Tessaracoccus antarcticus TaxID=2479848 RepID=UPI0011C493B4|nr:hypothetical protein [Tessaracoccus antarcticus]
MDHKREFVGVLCTLALATGLSACGAPIPREAVPEGWALEVHQPGEWWTQPLIPRSVVVQRCPPPIGWASEPDLSNVTGVLPGSDVEYSFASDDYHCSVGWSEPASEGEFSVADMSTEAGLRRACSRSGLPMDASWRFLGSKPSERVGDLPGMEEGGLETWEVATAAFIDEFGTVVSCLVEHMGDAGTFQWVELSVGADTAVTPGGAACPVQPRNMARDDDGTLMDYQLRGAGAVREDRGKILTEATTLRIGVVGDSVMTSHPVVDGIAIVDASVVPNATIPFDWDQPLPVEGQIYDADGDLLATCRG